MRRMVEEFGDERFERLASISNGNFYNLRKSTTYRRRRTTYRKTRARQVAIGERRKPRPRGRPGFLRVDTVDQGEKDGEKGVFHINLVCEVTQWEHVGTVRAISENCLIGVLRELIEACPFKVLGFHADNGSEYINHRVSSASSSATSTSPRSSTAKSTPSPETCCLPQLPPPLPVPHPLRGRTGTHPDTLPLPGHDDAVREAQVPARG